MLGTLVRYLRSSALPFRLVSYPSFELEPAVAHPLPSYGMLVDSTFLRVGGQLVLATVPAGERIALGAIGHDLGGVAVEVPRAELSDDVRPFAPFIPPLGGLFAVTSVIDTRVATTGVVVFRAFSPADFVEVPYEDYARLERPRVASFAVAGELVAASPTM
jgi:hypothetical protein